MLAIPNLDRSKGKAVSLKLLLMRPKKKLRAMEENQLRVSPRKIRLKTVKPPQNSLKLKNQKLKMTNQLQLKKHQLLPSPN